MNVPELEGCYVYVCLRFCIALRQYNWLLCCSSLERLKPVCLSRICFLGGGCSLIILTINFTGGTLDCNWLFFSSVLIGDNRTGMMISP
jgi:hypothetical protein